jgi:hypothetical protein
MTKHNLFIQRLEKYKKNSEILRQIHSNKAIRKHRYAIVHLSTTLILTAIVSFIGFMGIDKFSKLIDPNNTFKFEWVEFIFNVSVFGILVLIILELIFNFKDMSHLHNKSINILTGFIRDIDDLLNLQNFNDEDIDQLIYSTRERYKLIAEILPPSTDKEFIKSKKDYVNKKQEIKYYSNLKSRGSTFLLDPSFNKKEKIIGEQILEDSWMQEVLKAVTSLKNNSLWISGGFVRNKIWDYKHRYRIRTRLGDVDIIYFDQANISVETDHSIESKLKTLLPNIIWSVKNQARMNTKAGDEPYTSLYDALYKWPETATAIAIQIDEHGFLKIIAPYGYDDLFSLVVRPPDYFRRHHIDRYLERIKNKNWIQIWPKLNIKLK